MSSRRQLIHCVQPWFHVAMIVSLAAVGGCSAFHSHRTLAEQANIDWADYEAQIRKVITEPGKADQMIALSSQFRQLVKDNIVTMKDYQAKAAALNSNYDATRADYDALFLQQDASREAFVTSALKIREQMASLTTDSEWEQLRKYRERSITASLEQLKL